MYTILDKYIFEYVIKKSRFIVLLIPINKDDNINNILEGIKDEYAKATHYCYAYKLGVYSKYSDDGEPSGTAGIPILNALNSRDLNNILCVVIRYFGGIKFGASPLLRTYGKVVRDSCDNIKFSKIIEYYYLDIEFNYDSKQYIDSIVNLYVFNKYYDDKVHYSLKIPMNKKEEILDKLKIYLT